MEQYEILYGSGDASYNGLWLGERQIASYSLLDKLGYDSLRMIHWSQEALAAVARRVEKYLSSLPPVVYYQPKSA